MQRWPAFRLLFLLGLLASCGELSSPASPTTEPPPVNLAAVPDVDTSAHSVTLDDIYFDTFRPGVDRVVPLSEATPDLILSLRDRIPPLYAPNFESPAQTDSWLGDDELVLGYADSGEAYAYPMKILNWHEMVLHDVNGKPILATY